MTQPEIAVLVSSFQRPGHLGRVLTSLAVQQGVRGAFEVVVTDDGSRDDTAEFVRRFAETAPYSLQFVTHPHDGFQLARCRNEGVAASTAPYLLFLDGDCVVPRDHLRIHLDRRREKLALAGYYFWLSEDVSKRLTTAEIESGRFVSAVSWRERLTMRWAHVRAQCHSLVQHSTRPKLLGGNLGVARADYERVNGYDENFRGWGCEDDDLRLRLRAAGVGVASISWWTQAYHLWHPKAPSAPDTWRAGANVEYLMRPLRLTQCIAGLVRRKLDCLAVEIVGSRPPSAAIERLLPDWCRRAIGSRASSETAEIQIAFDPNAAFSPTSDCRLLVLPEAQSLSGQRHSVGSADLVFADSPMPWLKPQQRHPLAALRNDLARYLGALPLSPQKLALAPAA
jgi:glycosyltransferase involved in cell wall biosynthesis